MKKLRKRILCIAIVLSLVFTDSAISVFADNEVKDSSTGQNETKVPIAAEEAYITNELVDLRTEYSKTYEKSDGSRVSVISSTALHYYDKKEKSWKEYDNTLSQVQNSDGDKVFANNNSKFIVEIPKNLNNKNDITTKYDKYEISILPLDTLETEIKKKEIKPLKQKSLKNKTVADHFKESFKTDEVEYDEAYTNTSLEYEVVNNSLKETITLSTLPEKETSYKFELSAKGLKVELNEDGSVVLREKNKTVFVIPSPFMVDSDNNFSDDIKSELTKEKDKYILTYTPNFDWLSDKARVYPVSIDPTLTLANSNNIEDAYVSTVNPNKNYGNTTSLSVGKQRGELAPVNEYSKEYISYIKFKNLPENIWNNSYVTKATLNLDVFNAATSQINVYEVTSDWNENTVTYNNKPTATNKVLDYENVSSDNKDYKEWDITNLIEKWYNNPDTNYGIMLQSPSIYIYPSYIRSSEYTGQNPTGIPYITIEYTSMTNSAYANSRDIDVGNAGSVNINDFTGNVRLVRNDLGVDGNIMPVNISMIYDQNNLALSSEFITDAYGKGFRTNYSQRIFYDSEKEIYTYIGSDARPVYFEKSETDDEISFVDEANRGFELSASGTDYSNYTNVTVLDENSYKYFFDNSGRLVKIADMNLSAVKEANVTATSNDTINGIIKITYTSADSFLISQISDGVGRLYQFNYNGNLTNIEYKGNGEESLKTVTYSYNSDGTLASVVFPGNKTVSYEWDNNNLSKVVNADGYNFVFTYTDENLPRIQTVKEYASDGTLGEDISVSYAINKTTYTDNKTDEQEILQFDKYGNLLTSQNAYGYTLVNQYGSSELNTTSNTPNELINSFGYQKSEINMLSNTRALNGNSDWSGIQLSTDEKVFGTQSFKLSGTSSTSLQSVNLVKDQTYVFSAYVKTKNVKGNLGATIKVCNGDVTVNSDAQYVTGTSKWTRVATTFTADSNCTANMSLILDNTNSLAEAYFDGIQLEKGTTVSEYNYVVNPDFKGNSNWNSDSTQSETAPTVDSEKGIFCFVNEETPFDSECIKLFGDARYSNSVYQEITNLNGQKGDTYNFGGWSKATAAALRDNRSFGLKVEFYNGSDLVGDPCTLSFNSYINDWQYNMSSAVASDSYTSIVISAVYDYQVNDALFDRLQLQYAGLSDVDETTEEDASEDSTTDESSDTSVKDEHGREIEYTDEDGVKTITAYDAYDNVTRSATEINGKILDSNKSYTADGNYQASETNALGKTTTYDYNTNLGLLNKVTDAEGNTINYSYDTSDNISTVLQGNASLSYEYDNGDRLNKINNSPYYSYNFGYDKFGALSNIKFGNQTLVEYSYDDNYILSKIDYANGQTVNYNYDNSGNKLGISSDGSEKYSYYYDDFGNLLSAKDNVNNVVTSHSTDEDGIEYTQERKNNTLIHSYYNTDSALIEYLNGVEKETIHSSKISSDSDTNPLMNWTRTSWKKNGYNTYYNVKDTTDEFGRTNTQEIFEANLSDDKQTESDKDILIRKSYEYTTTNNGVNQSEQVSKIKYEGTYNKEIAYTYDDNGNIICDGKYEYEYDDENRLAYVTEISTGKTALYMYNDYNGLYAINYYDENGERIDRKTYSYSKTKLTKFNNQTITYDALGNPLTYYNGTQFTWQMGRQLASATLSDGTEISYKYNADGIRTEKKVGNTTTSYTLIGSKITGQTDGTNTFYFRYDENDNLVGFELGSNQYFYITNLVGDIIAIVDNQGAAVVEYTYDPWGKCTIVSDTSNCNLGTLNPFRYRCYYYDEDTGLYYLQSRYYDCNTCKFINADDPNILLADPYNVQSIYLYDYCGFNPVMNIDTEGYKYFIYSRSSALAYAAKYAWYRNKAYYDYRKTDCANFVSQCMYAAGLVMDNKWYSYRYTCFNTRFTSLPNNYRYKWNVSKAWSKVIEQHDYLMSSGYVSRLRVVIRRADLIQKVLSNRTVKIGDIMYFDEDGNGRLDHATIITNVTKKDIFYSAHTKDRLNCNLKEFFKSYKKGVAYILHFNK